MSAERRPFVVHGKEDAALSFAHTLVDRFGADVTGLERGQTVDLGVHANRVLPCVVRWLLVGVGCACGVHRLGNRIDGIAQRLTAPVE